MSSVTTPRVRTGILASLGSQLCWSVGPITVHYLRHHYTAYEFNCLRMTVAACFTLWLAVRWTQGISLRDVAKQWKSLTPAILILYVCQVFWVEGLARVQPGFSMLIAKTDVVFATAFSALFFLDERRIMTKPLFALGAVAALAGCGGIVFFKGSAGSLVASGTWLISTAAVLYAAYQVSLKRPISCLGALPCVAAVLTGQSICFVASIPFHPGSSFANLVRPGIPLGIVVFSGIVCMGMANAFHYTSIRHIGIAVSAGLSLLQPLLTFCVSAWIFAESMTLSQWVFVPFLLGGCGLITKAKADLSKEDRPPPSSTSIKPSHP